MSIMHKLFLIAALIFGSTGANAQNGPRTYLAQNCIVSEAVKLSKDNQENATTLAEIAVTRCEEYLPAARQEIFEKAFVGFGGRSDQAERATYTLMIDFLDQAKSMAISAIIIDRLSKP